MDISSSTNIILLLLMAGSFLKLLVTIGLLGQGLGLSNVYFLFVNFALSLGLACLMFEPVLGTGTLSFFNATGVFDLSVEQLDRLRLFLQKNTDADVVQALSQAVLAKFEFKADDFNFLSLAYLLTELREAFTLGALLLLPFLLIDLLLAVAFSAMSIQAVSVGQVALPLKILLFVGVDGWSLLTQNFINQYNF